MDDKNVYKLFKEGADIVGDVASEGLLMSLTGPFGSLAIKSVGKVIAAMITKIGGDIYSRTLSPRERVRLGAVGIYMLTAIQERLEMGETYRTGDFWEACGIYRSKAEEILEGVWLNAKDTYEEKKLPHLGNIYAFTAFSNISYHAAHQILKLVDVLSHRQLCILALYNKDVSAYQLREASYDPDGIDLETEAVLQEIFQLYNQQLISGRMKPSDPHFTTILDVSAIHPAYLELSPLARKICDMASLDKIEEEDILTVAKRLR